MSNKRPAAPAYTTNESFAYTYLEDRRVPKFVRIKAKFPLISDRNAINIDYTDPTLHRSYGGKAPVPSVDNSNLSINPPRPLDSAEYKFYSDAPNGSNVPEGFMGTSSGIVPIVDPPFTQGGQHGYQTDFPMEINGVPRTTASGSWDFIYAKNVETTAMTEKADMKKPYDMPDGDTKMEWQVTPEYQAPVFPQARTPNGAVKRRPLGR